MSLGDLQMTLRLLTRTTDDLGAFYSFLTVDLKNSWGSLTALAPQWGICDTGAVQITAWRRDIEIFQMDLLFRSGTTAAP